MKEVAKRYAKALFSLTDDESRLQQDVALLTETPALWCALKNPSITGAEKYAVLERLFGASAEPLFLHFYGLLCKWGRLSLLPEIAKAYHQCVLTKENRGEGRMRCTVPPSPTQKQALCQALCNLQGKQEVTLEVIIDPTILGGFVLELDGISYDKSLGGSLQALLWHLQGR